MGRITVTTLKLKRNIRNRAGSSAVALIAALGLVPFQPGRAQDPTMTDATMPSAADDIAEAFSAVGDQLYEECIFDLSDEQVAVQAALIQSYMEQGATSAIARKLAATQIQPPKPAIEAAPKLPPQPPPSVSLAGKQGLPQWDCAPGVDYVTIHLNGYMRKLTGGEICSPFEDVVHEVPASLQRFLIGYTIRTGRLFVISDDPRYNGKTIAWGLSGRDVCRNNPDPDCFAAKAIGPLPPGEYAFASSPSQRVSWGPRTKRNVAGVWLKKLWNKDHFNPQQTAAILRRGNIAIHLRLKGEMSEACIGLEPKGWAHIAALIKDGRATSMNVYIDEPYPQIAENPPIVVASTFSLTSLFK